MYEIDSRATAPSQNKGSWKPENKIKYEQKLFTINNTLNIKLINI